MSTPVRDDYTTIVQSLSTTLEIGGKKTTDLDEQPSLSDSTRDPRYDISPAADQGSVFIHSQLVSGSSNAALPTSIPSPTIPSTSGGMGDGPGSPRMGGASGASGQHYRFALNNAVHQGGQALRYKDSHTGPSNNPQWTSVVYLNHVERGRGFRPSKGAARENAAKRALVALGFMH
ncbi:hypothetical protein B0H13DRAFT_2264426 [Mycena leptocephala]|nr:hypothetical protein B0H13DRAFT_2264426 [Mycena leptocephala]